MGTETGAQDFHDRDYLEFAARMRNQLELLRGRLDRGELDDGPTSLGAELELYLVDKNARPLPRNRELLERANNPYLQLELNRFNLEYNLPPVSATGRPFSKCARMVEDTLGEVNRVAAGLGGRVAAVGILPGLRIEDFHDCMTDSPRYRALAENLRRIRGQPFHVHIRGRHEEVVADCDDVSLEGANSSWQLHLRVGAREFADWFNAIQLVTPLALGMAGNSSLLFGKALWEETRVALFRQSIDSRVPHLGRWHQPARVSCGEGWVRRDAWELFAGAVALYPPIIPECFNEPPENLAELRLHMGTVWLWNRPVYDPADGGHLRIEMRALPAGPSAVDMAATSAFLVGAANALRPEIEQLIAALPFRYCEHNFLEAARRGLGSRMIWPCSTQVQLFERPLEDIVRELLPRAREGLEALGVDAAEARSHCDLVQARLDSHQTGSTWLRRARERLGSDPEAISRLMEHYLAHQASGRPVHEWELPE